jgi:hypothetical protein
MSISCCQTAGRLTQPQVIDAGAASAAFSSWQMQGMRRFNMRQCLLLRHAA